MIQLTCQKHAPANDGYEEVACLGDKLEGAVQMEQCEDVLHQIKLHLLSKPCRSIVTLLRLQHISLLSCSIHDHPSHIAAAMHTFCTTSMLTMRL